MFKIKQNYIHIDYVNTLEPLNKEAFDKSCDSLNINLTLKRAFM